MGAGASSPARIAELSEQWVDPVTDAPPGTTYHLFETASRGKGSKGSYLVYLPPSYETETARRYPVIYWLHGGFGNARQGAWAVEHLDRGIRAGLVPEAIVVLPQALPVGWYVNSKDGKRPIEDVIIKDLIPHVDATYRTIDRRESRGIEGMSMGGYGALHLGMKHPTLFGAISSVAPAILQDLKDEPRERTFDTFGDDEAYYDANGPWALARANATALRRGCAIRLLAGDEDARLRSAITGFHELLTELGIPHQFSEVRGAGHVYEDIVGGLGDEGFAFWRQAFGTRPAPSLVDPYVARPRVVVMTDIANEPDDQMSLVRFLLYSNQWDVEGLVATTSTWMKARVRPDVILSVLDAYEKVQPNLLKHAPGFPAAAALRAVVASGQPAYGMAAVGEGKTSPGAELILRAAERDDPRPLWVLAWGGDQHARPGALLRAVHAIAGAGRGPRLEAARLRDLRPGRRRPVDPPRVPGPALRRDAVHAERRGVLLRDLDGHQRRPFLPQRAGGGLHDVHRRVGERERPEQGAARGALSLPVLHPRGGHAVVPGPRRQRARERHEPGLRRVGRAVRVAPALRRDAPLLDPGGRLVPGERQLARHGDRCRREVVHVRPGHDLAVADGVPERLRRAHGLDDQDRRRGEPQPAGRGERPAGDGASRPRRARSARP